jgi:2-polyprenyl-6-hydroxyphenyl methylase/3-demethylubiquinone-9 3-methyltransferase
MTTNLERSGYKWRSAEHTPIHADLLPSVDRKLKQLNLPQTNCRIFDLGCGNGSVANYYATKGFEVVGIDPSTDGIQFAKTYYPTLNLFDGSAYDDLANQYGQFPIVLSLEVVEHLYSPKVYAKTLYNLVAEGGVAIISTPYHGYFKNLALSVTGQMDAHFTALWDHGHIKFWSIKTLSTLLKNAGFRQVEFERVGRVPFLAKSMVATAIK